MREGAGWETVGKRERSDKMNTCTLMTFSRKEIW